MKPVVVLYDVHDTDQDQYRTAFGSDARVTVTPDGLSDDTAALAAEAQIIAVHVTSAVTAELMKRMPKLRHVACRSTGFDHVDLAYAGEHGITVSTVPSYGEDTVAEYTFMLLLAISRRLMESAHSMQTGVAKPEELVGHDLNGRTLGVVGTGHIGRHAIQIARGFDMSVVAYDPFPNDQAAKELGFEYLPLDELLARADCISLHAPSTPKTHHLLDTAAFAKMRPGVFIVNTARGTLIDTPALIAALESGKVAGAGLDVLEGEEYSDDAVHAPHLDRLSKLPNVVITTHNAYNSVEALARIRQTSIENIKAALAGSPQNPPR